MRKTKLEKDIERTINILRYLTKGQGYAAVSVFDAGAGGGFTSAVIQINLERDGLIYNKEITNIYTLKHTLISLSGHDDKLDKKNESYKNRVWDE